MEARMARRQGELQRAMELGTEALRLAKAADSRTARLSAHLLLADLACDTGDAARADKELKRAVALASTETDSLLRAETERTAGRLALATQQGPDAGLHYDAAAEILRKAGRYREQTSRGLSANRLRLRDVSGTR